MSDTASGRSASSAAFLAKIPDIWKVIAVMIAIAGAAIGVYQVFDNERDALAVKDRELEAADEKLQAADLALGKRIDGLAAAMVSQADLSGFIAEDTLREERCRQTLRAEKHEFQALSKAYEELIQAMRLAESAFANRELSGPEERQFLAVVELRSGFESRKREMEREVQDRDSKIQSTEGC